MVLAQEMTPDGYLGKIGLEFIFVTDLNYYQSIGIYKGTDSSTSTLYQKPNYSGGLSIITPFSKNSTLFLDFSGSQRKLEINSRGDDFRWNFKIQIRYRVYTN